MNLRYRGRIYISSVRPCVSFLGCSRIFLWPFQRTWEACKNPPTKEFCIVGSTYGKSCGKSNMAARSRWMKTTEDLAEGYADRDSDFSDERQGESDDVSECNGSSSSS